MMPELHLPGHPGLVDLMPGAAVAVTLYWQHWEREAPSAQRLTQAVKAAADRYLLPPGQQGAPTRA